MSPVRGVYFPREQLPLELIHLYFRLASNGVSALFKEKDIF